MALLKCLLHTRTRPTPPKRPTTHTRIAYDCLNVCTTSILCRPNWRKTRQSRVRRPQRFWSGCCLESYYRFSGVNPLKVNARSNVWCVCPESSEQWRPRTFSACVRAYSGSICVRCPNTKRLCGAAGWTGVDSENVATPPQFICMRPLIVCGVILLYHIMHGICGAAVACGRKWRRYCIICILCYFSQIGFMIVVNVYAGVHLRLANCFHLLFNSRFVRDTPTTTMLVM